MSHFVSSARSPLCAGAYKVLARPLAQAIPIPITSRLFGARFRLLPAQRSLATTVPMASESVPPETVEKDGKKYGTVKEGKATILVAQDAKAGDGDKAAEVQQVFYNPIQQYNRDLSVLAIKTYGEHVLHKRRQKRDARDKQHGKKRKRGDEDGKVAEAEPTSNTEDQSQPPDAADTDTSTQEAASNAQLPFKILDALSASGLRALRYAHELPFVTNVKANDLSASAAESIQLNVDHNGLSDKISVTNDDALAHMYRAIADGLSNRDKYGNPSKSHKFDVVDLDPYGSGAPFFDAAVQAVRDDGGLLCITCTDSAVWAGHSYCEKTFALYGGVPIKGMHSHEAGLRLILHAVATSAARYGLTIDPLLSLSIDFYTKLFIRVTRSPNAVKFLGSKTMIVYSCDQGCGSWETQPLLRSKPTPNKTGNATFYKHGMALGPMADQHCRHCGFKTHLSGPMYGGRIHSSTFVQQLLDQIPNADPNVYGTLPRLEGMLRTALEEDMSGPEAEEQLKSGDAKLAVVDPCPFFIIPGKVAGVLSCSAPGDDMFRGALRHLGYQVARSHCRPGSVKTNAPWSTIWWVMAEYIRQKAPIKTSKFKPAMAAWKILYEAGLVGQEQGESAVDGEAADSKMEGVEKSTAEPDANATPEKEKKGNPRDANGVRAEEAELRKTLVFNEQLAKLGRQRDGQRIVRYQMNPRENWGPMSRAKGN